MHGARADTFAFASSVARPGISHSHVLKIKKTGQVLVRTAERKGSPIPITKIAMSGGLKLTLSVPVTYRETLNTYIRYETAGNPRIAES
jgi:hypothetical protein